MPRNPKIVANSQKIQVWLYHKMVAKELDNEAVLQLIELLMFYGGVRTIPDYSKQHRMSYNGVKNHRQIREINGVKYVIDNK